VAIANVDACWPPCCKRRWRRRQSSWKKPLSYRGPVARCNVTYSTVLRRSLVERVHVACARCIDRVGPSMVERPGSSTLCQFNQGSQMDLRGILFGRQRHVGRLRRSAIASVQKRLRRARRTRTSSSCSACSRSVTASSDNARIRSRSSSGSLGRPPGLPERPFGKSSLIWTCAYSIFFSAAPQSQREPAGGPAAIYVRIESGCSISKPDLRDVTRRGQMSCLSLSVSPRQSTPPSSCWGAQPCERRAELSMAFSVCSR
jgi:hypothetical protein